MVGDSTGVVDVEAGKRSTVSRIVGRLRDYIQSHGLRDGSKLPPERVLAAELKVSRPTLREAIKALTILDVVESRRGDGTYVRSLSTLKSEWPASVEIEDSAFSMLDLLEVRKMFEPHAARLAAARASEADLAGIEGLRHALESESADYDRIGNLDCELHAAIVHATRNSILIHWHQSMRNLLLRSRELTARTAPDWTRMNRDHDAIVRAIVRGESEAAGRAMLEHLHNIGLDLISSRKR